MGLERLTIVTESGQEIAAYFNPNSYTISKAVNWWYAAPSGTTASNQLNAPPLEFGGGNTRVLSFDLFYDVTDQSGDADVRVLTDDIVELTRITKDVNPPRPPWCTVHWGSSPCIDFPFTGVIASLTQTFTLFHASGKPLRAVLGLSISEYPTQPTPSSVLRSLGLPSSYVTVEGDTMPLIAAKLSRPGKQVDWRSLAALNGIADPENVPVGMRLLVLG